MNFIPRSYPVIVDMAPTKQRASKRKKATKTSMRQKMANLIAKRHKSEVENMPALTASTPGSPVAGSSAPASTPKCADDSSTCVGVKEEDFSLSVSRSFYGGFANDDCKPVHHRRPLS